MGQICKFYFGSGKNYVLQITAILVLISHCVKAHVSLTYPLARKFDLDFLDSVRSKPPCGMPKGTLGTTLIAGVPINISWHLAYPHRGGYRLELLDKDENFLLDLIKRDKSEEYIQGDPTAQWHTVTIPKEFTCEDCTIRLLRQASEWANSYRFWSCADVKIVLQKEYKEDCLGRGIVGENGCKCNKAYWGPRCQFEDECSSNTDCGKGTCVDLGGTSLPRKQCFCPKGLHGLRCSLKNLAQLATKSTLDLKNHTKKELSDKMLAYYKVVQDSNSESEIEFVLVINGTSYGALGWRPVSFNKSCKFWPYINENHSNSRLTRETSRYGKIMHRPNPTLLKPLNDLERERLAQPEPEMGKRKQKSPRPEKQRVAPSSSSKISLPEPEIEPESESSKNSHAIPEPEAESEHAKKSPIPEPEAESGHAKKSPIPEPEAESGHAKKSPIPEPEAESEHAKNSPIPEPEAESEHAKKSPIPEPEAEPEHAKNSPIPETEAESEHAKKSSIPEPEAESGHAKNSPIPEPEAESEHAKKSPIPEPEAESEHAKKSPIPEPETESEQSKSEPEPHAEQESTKPLKVNFPRKSAANSSPEPEPEFDSSSEPEPETNAFTKETRKSLYSPKGDFHAMDCTDIVIGAARGAYSRILDYYTRDRSTPRLDEFWTDEGSNSITSATGWQTDDGQTVIIFRRKLSSSEPTDHDIKGLMHIIWARGQEQGQYVHSPKSGIEKESPSIPNFYAEDEIKYHGHRGQRGVTFIEF